MSVSISHTCRSQRCWQVYCSQYSQRSSSILFWLRFSRRVWYHVWILLLLLCNILLQRIAMQSSFPCMLVLLFALFSSRVHSKRCSVSTPYTISSCVYYLSSRCFYIYLSPSCLHRFSCRVVSFCISSPCMYSTLLRYLFCLYFVIMHPLLHFILYLF